jgi:cytochrome c553
MTPKRTIGAMGVLATCAAVVLVAMVSSTTRVKAMNQDEGKEDWRVRRGFEIAPVPLNLKGKDLRAVGLGSYLVNAVASCNDCHSAGPQSQYLPGYNPFFGQPAKTNPATYLGGGRDFGPLIPDSPDIISRNLTPDKTGLPEGGHTFAQFRKIMQTGKDFDHLHPSCSATVTTDCLPPPFDGALLQIMPWPNYQHLTDQDLWAIYQYLRAVPCIEGPADPSNPRHNDCR